MPQVKAPNCPNCHAPLRVRPDAVMAKCEYCGREVMLKHTQIHPPAQPAPPPPQPFPPHVGPAHGRQSTVFRRQYRKTWLLSVGVTFAVVGVSMWISWQSRNAAMERARALSDQAIARAQTATAAATGTAATGDNDNDDGTTRVVPDDKGYWEAIDSGVLPARIDGDDVEDFLIRFQRSGDPRPVFVVAIDGARFERLWTAGPYGEGSDGSRYTHVAATDAHVVVTGDDSRAHVLELATGRERGVVTMSDRADGVCTSPDGAHAWVEVSDKHHVLVELATGDATHDAERPAWCPRDRSLRGRTSCIHYGGNTHRGGHGRAQCSDPPRRWKLDGIGRAYALAAGDVRVVIGSKSPGTAYPIVAGIGDAADGKRKRKRASVAWRIQLGADTGVKTGTPEVADIAGDTVVVGYEREDETWRLLALDTADGATRWEAQVPQKSSFGYRLTLSDTRAYLLAGSLVVIYDLATGDQHAALASQ